MNRRGFLSSILQAGAAAMVLPGALTYARTWKRTETLLVPAVNPAWKTAQYDVLYLHPFDPKSYCGEWKFEVLTNWGNIQFPHTETRYTAIPLSIQGYP